jgi:hypothetical protein
LQTANGVRSVSNQASIDTRPLYNSRIVDNYIRLIQKKYNYIDVNEPLRFSGMQPYEVAGSHHEKLLGSGYPNGLMGDTTPLGSRIIAVADFFEAITAKCHYRGPMSSKRAFELLLEDADRRFDQEVVDAFCRYSARDNARQPEYSALVI